MQKLEYQTKEYILPEEYMTLLESVHAYHQKLPIK